MKGKFGQSVEEVVRLRGLYLLIRFRQTIHWSCLNVDGKTPIGEKKKKGEEPGEKAERRTRLKMDERSWESRINNSTYWVKILFLIQRDYLLLIVNYVISFLSNITNANKSSALKIHLQTTHSPVKKTFFHLSLSSGSPHWWHLQSFIKLNPSSWNIDGFINSYFSQLPLFTSYILER